MAPCGGEICQPYSGPGLNLPLAACCADQFSKTCGVQIGSSCRKPPEKSHPTCASVDMSGFGFVLFGCCVDNKCGLVDSFSGGDTCRDIESIQAMADMMGRGGFLPLPPAMSCE